MGKYILGIHFIYRIVCDWIWGNIYLVYILKPLASFKFYTAVGYNFCIVFVLEL